MRPLVIVPYITTQVELKRKKYLIKYVLAAIVALTLLLLVIIHFAVMPLDLLIVKLMVRFA